MINRKIVKITNPKEHPGFLGEGHIAVHVIDGSSPEDTDPFILLMDDQLDLPGHGVVGGAHPHAGFEIATLVLEGETGDGLDGLAAGDLEWLTAGSGIVHTEEIKSQVRLRVLQLWFQLPKDKMWIEPKWQKLPLQNTPLKKLGDSEIRVYSGRAFGLTSPVLNEVPMQVLYFTLSPNTEVNTIVPGSYNGFIYMIEGTIFAGEDKTLVEKQQVAWLDRLNEGEDSALQLIGGNSGARFVIYAGQPQKTKVYSSGPFISDKNEDFKQLYKLYRNGKMPHVNDLQESWIIHHESGLASPK